MESCEQLGVAWELAEAPFGWSSSLCKIPENTSLSWPRVPEVLARGQLALWPRA